MKPLVVFDFDGCLVVAPRYYAWLSGGHMEKLLFDEKGDEGVQLLEECRRLNPGVHPVALESLLIALNIPRQRLMEIYARAPIEELIDPNPELVHKVRLLPAQKVIYTGTDVRQAHRILCRIGFSALDFLLVCGSGEHDLIPMKWTRSALPFQHFRELYLSRECWAVGDSWLHDLMPAHMAGYKLALIGQKKEGEPDVAFPRVEDFIDFFNQRGARI